MNGNLKLSNKQKEGECVMFPKHHFIGFQTKRILSHPLKRAVLVLLFLFPFLDFLQNLQPYVRFEYISTYVPEMETFLAHQGGDLPVHRLLFWFLPLYFLILLGDGCVEDVKCGYRNVLMLHFGRKRYFFFNIAYGFGFAFLTMFLSLAFNAGLCAVTFRGGTDFGAYDPTDAPTWMANMFSHLQRTEWLYIVFASLLTGVVAAGAVALSIGLHNGYVVYPLVYLMWYIPFSMERSVMLALQPFCEYPMSYSKTAVLMVIGFNLAAVLVGGTLYYFEWNDLLKKKQNRGGAYAQHA